MKIIRLRTFFRGNETVLMRLWKSLIDQGHQRFIIEDTGIPETWWIDLFLPELLKYGLSPDNRKLINDSFFWPWPENLLRPVFKTDKNQVVMFISMNYNGIFYDPSQDSFKPYPPPVDCKIPYNEKLRHTKILRELGMPFDVFQYNLATWPIIDFSRLEDKYEYYLNKTSEV